jgi:hypothetical protein
MSATTTVLATSAVSADDIELVSNDHNHGQDTTNSTHSDRKPGRDWKLLFQLISCGVSFFVAGVNDGSLGALLPYIIRSYGLTTAIASSVLVAFSPLAHHMRSNLATDTPPTSSDGSRLLLQTPISASILIWERCSC